MARARRAVAVITEAEKQARAEDVALIRSQPGSVIIGRDHKTPHRRLDVFGLMFERKALTERQVDAVRRLQRDLELADGVSDHERPMQRLDGLGGGPNWDRMIDASKRSAAALKACGLRDGRMLAELCNPTTRGGVLTRWRDIVQRLTRETNAHAQSAAVRSAVVRLEEHYIGADNAPRRVA